MAIKDLIRPVQKWSSGEVAGDFTYIDLASVDQTAKTIEKPKRLRVADAPSRARQLIQAGDVLVSTVRPNLNAVALVSSQFSGATASTGFCVLRPNSFMLHGRYLFHWVKNPRFVSGLMSLATGASYPAVSDKQIKGTTIPLPPLAEQRRIAEVLDRADALRAKRRAALAQLDELTQSIFLDTFGTKRDWPSRWPQGTVAEAGTVQLGRQRSPKYQTGRFSNKYLRVANVYENRI
ncbi:MAG: restriction endonuclease subunit S, partial [Actinomycetota bacterium]